MSVLCPAVHCHLSVPRIRTSFTIQHPDEMASDESKVTRIVVADFHEHLDDCGRKGSVSDLISEEIELQVL
jgi:hypothetical protein